MGAPQCHAFGGRVGRGTLFQNKSAKLSGNFDGSAKSGPDSRTKLHEFQANILQTGRSCAELELRCAQSRQSYAQPKVGCTELKLGCGQLKLGCAQLKAGCEQPRLGCGQLKLGCGQLKGGCGQLKVGCVQLKLGRGQPKPQPNMCCFTNAEGVRKFQPRATPWERTIWNRWNSERVRQSHKAVRLFSCLKSVGLTLANSFRVHRLCGDLLTQGVALGCNWQTPSALVNYLGGL